MHRSGLGRKGTKAKVHKPDRAFPIRRLEIFLAPFADRAEMYRKHDGDALHWILAIAGKG